MEGKLETFSKALMCFGIERKMVSMHTCSLEKFLNTGRLGRIQNGMTMSDMLEYLGPPPRSVKEEDVPEFWGYNELEMGFGMEEMPLCDWFQLERASEIGTNKTRRVASNLRMSLDGLTGQSRMSDFVRAVDDIDSVKILLLCRWHVDPCIYIREDMALHFNDGGWGYPPYSIPTLPVFLRSLDKNCGVVDIVCGGYNELEWNLQQEPDAAKYLVSGRQLLDAVSAGS